MGKPYYNVRPPRRRRRPSLPLPPTPHPAAPRPARASHLAAAHLPLPSQERRAELEEQLTPAQLSRCSFVPAPVVKRLIEENTFGDRWPSSGLITIVYLLGLKVKCLHLHGFDFFKEIDGKIHYMEDTHKANHHAAEEERICEDLVHMRRVQFVA